MTTPDPFAEALNDRLGPTPQVVVERLLARHGAAMTAIAVVVETGDGVYQVYSGGCTVLETIGMFAFGSQTAFSSMQVEEVDDDDEGSDGAPQS